jgi:hypothetical protein
MSGRTTRMRHRWFRRLALSVGVLVLGRLAVFLPASLPAAEPGPIIQPYPPAPARLDTSEPAAQAAPASAAQPDASDSLPATTLDRPVAIPAKADAVDSEVRPTGLLSRHDHSPRASAMAPPCPCRPRPRRRRRHLLRRTCRTPGGNRPRQHLPARRPLRSFLLRPGSYRLQPAPPCRSPSPDRASSVPRWGRVSSAMAVVRRDAAVSRVAMAAAGGAAAVVDGDAVSATAGTARPSICCGSSAANRCRRC